MTKKKTKRARRGGEGGKFKSEEWKGTEEFT